MDRKKTMAPESSFPDKEDEGLFIGHLVQTKNAGHHDVKLTLRGPLVTEYFSDFYRGVCPLRDVGYIRRRAARVRSPGRWPRGTK